MTNSLFSKHTGIWCSMSFFLVKFEWVWSVTYNTWNNGFLSNLRIFECFQQKRWRNKKTLKWQQTCFEFFMTLRNFGLGLRLSDKMTVIKFSPVNLYIAALFLLPIWNLHSHPCKTQRERSALSPTPVCYQKAPLQARISTAFFCQEGDKIDQPQWPWSLPQSEILVPRASDCRCLILFDLVARMLVCDWGLHRALLRAYLKRICFVSDTNI